MALENVQRQATKQIPGFKNIKTKTTNTSIQEKKRRYDRNRQDNIWNL